MNNSPAVFSTIRYSMTSCLAGPHRPSDPWLSTAHLGIQSGVWEGACFS
jgi:hypothetical protein